jgi:hypothetical protein
VSRPAIRTKIVEQLSDCLQQTQSLLDNVSETCDNMEPYFSETERFQTLLDTKDKLESAVEAIEQAQSELEDCEFPPMMPRKSTPLETAQ